MNEYRAKSELAHGTMIALRYLLNTGTQVYPGITVITVTVQ